MIHIKRGIIILAGVLVFFTACMGDHNQSLSLQTYQTDFENASTYVFECSDDVSFTVRIADSSAMVINNGEMVVLPLTDSTSGKKFSKDDTLFYYEEGETHLEVNGQLLTGCLNNRRKAIWEDARYRGIDIRAIGQEPGWMIELTESGYIVYHANNGLDMYTFSAPQPVYSARSRTYNVTEDNHDFQVSVRHEPCSDIMSGEKFDYAVIVNLDGNEVRGCGRVLSGLEF